jgi:LysR family glycine cleavage system transcriptional activator
VLHVESSGGAVDFERSGVDLAVRRADFDLDPEVVSEPLMDEWLGPVCSPAYARLLRETSPRVTLLHTRTRPHAFREFFRASGHTLVAADEQRFDHFAWSIQAAVAGLGMAMGPYPLVEEALSRRRLVAPLGFVRGDVGYVLLSRRPFEQDGRAASLRAWLKAEVRRMRRPRPAASASALGR